MAAAPSLSTEEVKHSSFTLPLSRCHESPHLLKGERVMKGLLGICGGSDSWSDRGRSDRPRREGPFITVIKGLWGWRHTDINTEQVPQFF